MAAGQHGRVARCVHADDAVGIGILLLLIHSQASLLRCSVVLPILKVLLVVLRRVGCGSGRLPPAQKHGHAAAHRAAEAAAVPALCTLLLSGHALVANRRVIRCRVWLGSVCLGSLGLESLHGHGNSRLLHQVKRRLGDRNSPPLPVRPPNVRRGWLSHEANASTPSLLELLKSCWRGAFPFLELCGLPTAAVNTHEAALLRPARAPAPGTSS